jgi:hypothetical protein
VLQADQHVQHRNAATQPIASNPYHVHQERKDRGRPTLPPWPPHDHLADEACDRRQKRTWRLALGLQRGADIAARTNVGHDHDYLYAS